MVSCPFCGFEFEHDDTLCHHGCPFGPLCGLVRCPSCDYEFPGEEERAPPLWRRLFGRPRRGAAGLERVLSVRQLLAGQRARVLALAGADERRHTTLAVFGLAPGCEILLLQRSPAFIVQVGETDLALDAEIAGEILVEAIAEGGLAP